MSSVTTPSSTSSTMTATLALAALVLSPVWRKGESAALSSGFAASNRTLSPVALGASAPSRMKRLFAPLFPHREKSACPAHPDSFLILPIPPVKLSNVKPALA